MWLYVTKFLVALYYDITLALKKYFLNYLLPAYYSPFINIFLSKLIYKVLCLIRDLEKELFRVPSTRITINSYVYIILLQLNLYTTYLMICFRVCYGLIYDTSSCFACYVLGSLVGDVIPKRITVTQNRRFVFESLYMVSRSHHLYQNTIFLLYKHNYYLYIILKYSRLLYINILSFYYIAFSVVNFMEKGPVYYTFTGLVLIYLFYNLLKNNIQLAYDYGS